MKRNTIVKIEPIATCEEESMIQFAYSQFSHIIDFGLFRTRLKSAVNWSVSVKLTENGVLTGVYLFGDKQIDYERYGKNLSNFRGIEGVCLMVKKSKQGKGYGRMLKNYVEIMGYDYIWGGHHPELDNIRHWLKRRELAYKWLGDYYTIQFFKSF